MKAFICYIIASLLVCTAAANFLDGDLVWVIHAIGAASWIFLGGINAD